MNKVNQSKMKKLFIFLIAVLAGVWMWYHPFPQEVNAFIVAFFVTLGLYSQLIKEFDAK